MGRRKKSEILENPQDFDFEIRPREIIPAGFENEAITKFNELFGKFGITNPLLNFVVATEEATFFRFDVEHTIPAVQDILGRSIGEPEVLQMRIHANCCALEEPLQSAYLFAEGDEKSFNNWNDVEIEFKGITDARLRKAYKYP